MSHLMEISDDDDSFSANENTVLQEDKPIIISSDDESMEQSSSLLSNDKEKLSETKIEERKELQVNKRNVIKKLFPTVSKPQTPENEPYEKYTGSSKSDLPPTSKELPKNPGINQMIGGVPVNLPVEPYGCQIALMFKVITAIKTKQNCLLESPTGSGKTLALLCGTLAWQKQERARLGTLLADQQAKRVTELTAIPGAVNYVAGVPNVNFNKSCFGERSIYDSPNKNDIYGVKRSEPCQDYSKDSKENMVTLHEKKRRLNYSDFGESSHPSTPQKPSTPEKPIDSPQAETPENVRFLVNLMRNWVSDDVHFSLPTIYYGARTHKQLQQVIKEFGRTSYCGEAKMTVLSSREYSCIREFDRKIWSSKNDMCRGCVKSFTSADKPKGESNCKFYDNRTALNHNTLPPTFDLEDLVKAGEHKGACPYYGARLMTSNSHIVFCPYNYLIEPSIRNSLQIDLTDNIVIIDEAHNIEDICRDAASFSFTKENVLAAISELEKVAGYLYSTNDISTQVDYLLKTFKEWDTWFANQVPLLNKTPVNDNEAVHLWEAANFAQTLDNHNIGIKNFPEFKMNAEAFCQRVREDPRTLIGVSQATATLVETINMALSYLFRDSCQFMDDFKPALVRIVSAESLPNAVSWRSSQFNQSVKSEVLELRLLCMSPALVFSSLQSARCLVLASGTLSPLISLHSELGTSFPLQVTPNHVIPPDRVWVGTLSTGPDGSPLECKSAGTAQPGVQDAIGQTLSWLAGVTPGGILCFLPSYRLLNLLHTRWQSTGVWSDLERLKYIFMENRNVRDHNDIMEDYYKYVSTDRGAILFAVFRGKVSEGMDFKDHQARAVVTIGIPYPNTYDMAVKEKMKYNNKYEKTRNLLGSSEWLRVQAYRALNQAVGRCVRHKRDWGAVLMVDARFGNHYYTEHLAKWLKSMLKGNHHTYESLVNSANSIESFMQNMTIRDKEDI